MRFPPRYSMRKARSAVETRLSRQAGRFAISARILTDSAGGKCPQVVSPAHPSMSFLSGPSSSSSSAAAKGHVPAKLQPWVEKHRPHTIDDIAYQDEVRYRLTAGAVS
jgi:hypothetical protein